MLRDADIIVIDEADDPLSAAVAAHAEREHVVRARLTDAARAMTITQDGPAATVDPPAALLLRPLRPQPAMSDADDRFSWSEAFATVWSAAALTDRPVVNRPGEWGWSARTSASAVVTHRRTGLDGEAAEAYWHAMRPDPEFGFHQSLDDWRLVEAGEAPFGRSRALRRPRGWEQVIVVGTDAFRVTTADLGARDLESDSLRATARLGLSFAAVSWAIPDGDEPAVLARVNPFPTFPDCRPVLTDVARALIRWLTR
ncbi:hypothetical protein StrepF001_42175 [Streptomyces sp. F001]|uniref:hypothetical protein n=1 Tax=Streptomyces sp. F001 TaxID=1510026 RepID=UPI00101E3E1F|nr:hypothetical protein [Streptomyces sp. F001]RZB13785.1 hypothetical protein StrepF001_42175 [Streptomyces sp. F001]